MKGLSYLQAFSPKILRETRGIIHHGITVEDIDRYLLPLPKPVKITTVPKEERKQAF